MSNEYTTIKVKKEVGDTLKKAVAMLNKAPSHHVHTVAGLITNLAEAYKYQLTPEVIVSNNTGWIINGVPIITNSDGSKHYNELLAYEPIEAAFLVSDFIRREAMIRRFKKLAEVTDAK